MSRYSLLSDDSIFMTKEERQYLALLLTTAVNNKAPLSQAFFKLTFTCLEEGADAFVPFLKELPLSELGEKQKSAFKKIFGALLLPKKKRKKKLADESFEDSEFAALYRGLQGDDAYRDTFDVSALPELLESCAKRSAPNFLTALRHALVAALEKMSPGRPERFLKARRLLTELFSLSEDACDVCELLVARREFSCMEDYFFHELKLFEFSGRQYLPVALDKSAQKIERAIEQLDELGFCEFDLHDGDVLLLSSIVAFWQSPETQNLDKLFLGNLPKETHALEHYFLPARDLRHVRALLDSFEVNSPKQNPVHILFYGAPGTGKSTFAASLAKELGIKLITPRDNKAEGDSGRHSCERRDGMITGAAMLARGIFRQGQKAALLIDDADELLNVQNQMGFFLRGLMNSSEKKSKRWLNSFLERSDVPTIWIINGTLGIDPAAMRRFAYSVHFPELGIRERTAQWNYVAENNDAAQLFTKEAVEALARDYDVPVGVFSQAIAHSKKLYGGDAREFIEGIRQTIDSFEMLRNDGVRKRRKRSKKNGPLYDSAAVCLAPDAISIERLLQSLRHADARLRERRDLDAAACTMLFYGPPGTGKSAFARHIAEVLHREAVVIRASDWLDCYVGGTEHNISETFDRAQSEDAVLIIDEADSFLFPREQALRSFEVTQVNEFLTNLEAFRGICICTTNHEKLLDSASLRRFSFKVAFDYLSGEAAVALYRKMLEPIAGEFSRLDVESEVELRALCHRQPGLTPGDFRTVRAEFMFAEPADCTAKEMVLALRREIQAKRAKGVAIGFGR